MTADFLSIDAPISWKELLNAIVHDGESLRAIFRCPKSELNLLKTH